jgi:hypothetical protein
MAGIKKSKKKQLKRKSINKRTKRNVKSIKKYTRKNKMIGGVLPISGVRTNRSWMNRSWMNNINSPLGNSSVKDPLFSSKHNNYDNNPGLALNRTKRSNVKTKPRELKQQPELNQKIKILQANKKKMNKTKRLRGFPVEQQGFPFGQQQGFPFGQQQGFPFGQQQGFPFGQQQGFPVEQQQGFPDEQQIEDEEGIEVIGEVMPEDVEEINQLINFLIPNNEINSFDESYAQTQVDVIHHMVKQLKINVGMAYPDSIDVVYSSESNSNGFNIANNSSSDEMYDDVVRLITGDPLLFILKHDKIINRTKHDEEEEEEEEEQKYLSYLIKSYNKKYNTILTDFLAEFYEGDYNVYDDSFELTFDDYDLYYLCKSHLCYLVKKLINDKFLSLYNIYNSTEMLKNKDLPINDLERMDLTKNYVVDMADYFMYMGLNEHDAQMRAEMEIETRKKKINDEILESYPVGLTSVKEELGLDFYVGRYIINDYKINIHNKFDLEKFVQMVNREIDSKFSSFIYFNSLNMFDLFYDEIYDINHHFNVNTAMKYVRLISPDNCVSATSEAECTRINKLNEKLRSNYEDTVLIYENYTNYISNLRKVIQDYTLYEQPNLFFGWTTKLANTLITYEDSYYTPDILAGQLTSILESTFNINFDSNLLDYLNKIDSDWINQILKNIYVNDDDVEEEHEELEVEHLEEDPINTKRQVDEDEDEGDGPSKKGRFNKSPTGGGDLQELVGELSYDEFMKLIIGHMTYDNSHDFEFNVWKLGEGCDLRCSLSPISSDNAINMYESVCKKLVTGDEENAKDSMMELIEKKFKSRVTYKNFKYNYSDLNSVLNEAQFYIKKEILKLKTEDIQTELKDYLNTNDSTFFYFDQGSIFIQIMFQNKLPGTATAKSDESMMDEFQQNTLLKAWDSSTGGTTVGNKFLRSFLKNSSSNAGISEITKLITIAFNIHSFMSMIDYFTVFIDVLRGFFGVGNKIVVPVLQTLYIDHLKLTSLSGIKFKHYIQFMDLEKCIDIRKKLLELNKSMNFVNDFTSLEDFVGKMLLNKHIDPIGLNVIEPPTPGVKKTYASMEYDTNAKFSAGSIIKAFDLGTLKKRSEHTKKESITNVTNLFNHPAFSALTPNNRASYGYILKHSGDQCQGYQTQKENNLIYERMLCSIIGSTNSTSLNHILYTEDILAFCNAVFNGSNVFTIKHSADEITIIHTVSNLGVTKELVNKIETTYNNLLDFQTEVTANVNKDPLYIAAFNNELNFFKELIDEVNANLYTPEMLKQFPQRKENVINCIAKIEHYNNYVNLIKGFKTLGFYTDAPGQHYYEKLPLITETNLNKTLGIGLSCTTLDNDLNNYKSAVKPKGKGKGKSPPGQPSPEYEQFLKEKKDQEDQSYLLKIFKEDFHENIVLQFEVNESTINGIKFDTVDALSYVFKQAFDSETPDKYKNDSVKSLTETSQKQTRDWFNNLNKYLTESHKYFNKLNEILVEINKYAYAINFINNKAILNTFNIVNNRLYKMLEVLINSLVNPIAMTFDNVDYSRLFELSKITRVSKNKVYLTLQGPILYFLINDSFDKETEYYKTLVETTRMNNIQQLMVENKKTYELNKDLIKRILESYDIQHQTLITQLQQS